MINPYLLQCSYSLQPQNHEEGSVSIVVFLLTSILFASYGLGAFVLWQEKKKWNQWRTASFVSGCLTIVLCFSPAMVDFAHHSFRGHMLQHLLLGMLAPIQLVLGAPVLLALQGLPRKGAKVLSRILSSRFFHAITHPVLALVLNSGGMYALYLTPLYNKLHNSASLHLVVHLHFLAAGYLFTWVLIGPDPAARRPKLPARVIALFFSITAHAYLGKLMFAYSYPRNSIHSETEIQAGARMMYYGGDLVELILIIALFMLWYNKKGKPHYRMSAWDQ